MTDHAASLSEARAVKDKAQRLFRRFGRVCGVGITRQGDSYAVKVNFETLSVEEALLPHTIDGVPVVVHVIGQIRKQAH